jgi:YVTN family beta-propeller protein
MHAPHAIVWYTPPRRIVLAVLGLTLLLLGLGHAVAPLSVVAAGPLAYVANSGSNTVSVIDTGTNTIIASIPVGSGPVALGVFIAPAPTGAADLLMRLVQEVTGAGPGKSLVNKVQVVLTAVRAGDTATACGELQGFLNEVRAQAGKKLTLAQAQQLTTEATSIRTLLNCGGRT